MALLKTCVQEAVSKEDKKFGFENAKYLWLHRIIVSDHGMLDVLEFSGSVVQDGDVDLLPDVSICCSWNSRFLCVVRNIDQLSDGKVDLLVLVSTGRTAQVQT